MNRSKVPLLSAVVDHSFPAEKSIVLRYMNAFQFASSRNEDAKFKELLLKTSIREGARTFFLTKYKGVDIHVQDETSLMHTRTLKSVDGCVTIAHCLELGYRQVVFESGGNTGTALTAYGTKAGLETFLFLPDENVPLLNSKVFKHPKAHLISVDDPGSVKSAAKLFEESNSFPHIPRTSWRIEASKFRGMYLAEYLAAGSTFDWLVQTISAGFGPIGIFWALARYEREIGHLPRFLGIQQEANCPMYRAWKSKVNCAATVSLPSTGKLLSRVMYDSDPQTYGTRDDLMKLVDATRGRMATLDHAAFERFVNTRFGRYGVVDMLRKQGVDIPADLPEKTGLMSLAGAFAAIDKGTIQRGSTILCCLTSGMTDADGKVVPDYRISGTARQVGEYVRQSMRKVTR